MSADRWPTSRHDRALRDEYLAAKAAYLAAQSRLKVAKAAWRPVEEAHEKVVIQAAKAAQIAGWARIAELFLAGWKPTAICRETGARPVTSYTVHDKIGMLARALLGWEATAAITDRYAWDDPERDRALAAAALAEYRGRAAA